ncbi:DNA polymerase [Eubacterium pyruvativorans]|uniref:DNA polymerase n=1 Tax=Eubacterium pyruvativorans TaxID=155865 RepID=UPI000889A5D6|nr:DNA polymerase [Eubacterium pyruvativorans]SDF31412.1 DNA polymerase [Eubacterium pyruvativorans]
MKHLSIDIETYSSVDIGKAGAYRYAEGEDFEVLLFAYKMDDAPTEVIDLASGEAVPDAIVQALRDPEVIKHAYNAAFEWWCLNHAGYDTPIDQWQCTMIHGMYCGYPAGLEAIGEALGLPEDKKKLATGKALIRYFCVPCKATKSNGGRTRNLPMHDPEKWQLFITYNRQDVETEYAISQRLDDWPVPDQIWTQWRHDIELNARGVAVDKDLISGALYLSSRRTAELMGRAREITGLDNPNSNAQALRWMQERGIGINNMQKATVSDLLEKDLPGDVRELLEIKQQLGKTSVSKYEAMDRAVCDDGRIRGLLQFYGANRSGRWAGRLVQVQNLPRNYLPTLDSAREMVKKRNYTCIQAIYGNIPDTLSQLIRTAFVPAPGNKFIVSDFSAIEARVIAWLAGEDWVLDVFKEGGDIYCATASQMFGVPVEKHGVNGDLRQKGKVATLALGYQGGPQALISMGALKMGITEDELPGIVDKWRTANPNIVSLWGRVDKLVKHTVETAQPTYLGRVTFRLEGAANDQRALTIELPSGRKLFYQAPYLGKNRFGHDALHYKGVNQTTRKWEDHETYGGKLTENIVQAIARDCLAVTLERVIAAGYKPVMHIHDEIVIDAAQDQHLDDVNAIFSQPIDWAPGLPLKGDGFEAEYYKKD